MITKYHICELWRIKVVTYSSKSPIRIWETLITVAILLFISASSAGYDKQIVYLSLKAYLIYLIFGVALISLLDHLKNRVARYKYVHHYVTLIYELNEMGFITVLVASFLSISFFTLQPLFENTFFLGGLLFLLIIVLIMTVLSAPRIMISRTIPKRGNELRTLPIALAISGSASGMALLIFTLLTRLYGMNAVSFIILVGSLLSALLLFPYLILGCYEFIILCVRKWPRIQKLEKNFDVIY